MNDLTFNVLKLVVSVCTLMITIYVIPFIKKKIEAEKYSDLVDAIDRAVKAAEQKIGSGNGSLKKSEVMAFVLDYISSEGIKVTEQLIDNLVESAVFAMNNGAK